MASQLLKPKRVLAFATTLLLFECPGRAEIKAVIDRNSNGSASFIFRHIPPPSSADAAAGKKVKIISGERDKNGGGVEKLTDGKVPEEPDQPAENFFFSAGTAGGRLVLDLEKEIEIERVNTYSWHPGTRGSQVYTLCASTGKEADFAEPAGKLDPEKAGWKLITKIDTRQKGSENGGQYGVSISNSEGSMGKFRFLLFEVARTEADDDFGNTFYSEIDVIERNSSTSAGKKETVEIESGKYIVTVDTTEADYLAGWVETNVIPMVKEWYPKLVAMFPSKDFSAPTEFSISFIDGMDGVAATSGTKIRCSGSWIRSNLKGESLGAVFHEIVHVVQQYGGRRRANPDAPRRARPPGWLVEGIPDYVRWYKFEPQLHGADITRRNFRRAKYDGSYRITANFLNWTREKYAEDLARQLNAAIREGRYSEDLWKEITGRTVQELDAEWRKDLEVKLGLPAGSQTPEGAKENK